MGEAELQVWAKWVRVCLYYALWVVVIIYEANIADLIWSVGPRISPRYYMEVFGLNVLLGLVSLGKVVFDLKNGKLDVSLRDRTIGFSACLVIPLISFLTFLLLR